MMQFTMKIGAVVMATVMAVAGSVMWASPVSAQSDGEPITRITLKRIREDVQQARINAAAEVLGMEPDAVADALWGGKTLADLAAEADVPLSDVRAAVEDATQAARQAGVKELLAQMVENGRISQERADWIIEGMDNGWFGLGRLAERFDGFGRNGMRLGHGRMMDRMQSTP